MGTCENGKKNTGTIAFRFRQVLLCYYLIKLFLLTLAAWEWRRIVLDEPSQSYSKHRTVAC